MSATVLKFPEKYEKLNNYLSYFKVDSDIGIDIIITHSMKSSRACTKEDFNKRLSTFKKGFWETCDISPLLCAQYGWYLVKNNLLHCSKCKEYLCVKVPSFHKRQAYYEYLKILKGRIKSEHKDLCQWKTISAPLEFVQPTFSSQKLRYLIDICLQFTGLGEKIPIVNTKHLLSKLNLNERELTSLFYKEGNFDTVKVTAALLSLCGWYLNGNSALSCCICLRSIAIHQFFVQGEEDLFNRYEKKCKKKLRKFQKVRESKRRSLLPPETENDSIATSPSEKDLVLDEEMDFVELANVSDEEPDETSLLEDKMLLVEKSVSNQEESLLLNKYNEGTGEINSDVIFDVDEELRKSDNSSEDVENIENTQICVRSDDSKSSTFSDDLWTEAITTHTVDSTLENNETLDLFDEAELNETTDIEAKENLHNEENNCKKRLREKDEIIESNIKVQKGNTALKNNNDTENEYASESNEITDIEPKENLYNKENKSKKRLREEDDIIDGNKKAHKDTESDTNKNSEKELMHSEEEIICRKRKRSLGEESYSHEVSSKVSREECSESVQSLENFNEDSSDLDDVSDDNEEMNKMAFDPLGEHYYWCGWIQKAISSKGEKIPGHLIIPLQLHTLLSQSFSVDLPETEKFEKSSDGLRVIYSCIDDWIAPS